MAPGAGSADCLLSPCGRGDSQDPEEREAPHRASLNRVGIPDETRWRDWAPGLWEPKMPNKTRTLAKPLRKDDINSH